MGQPRLSTQVLKALAHPARLRLLNALRDDEECVCHLTTLLHQRQAYVSQQLMFLRRAGLIADRKDGLRVYYHIQDRRVIDILNALDALNGENAPADRQPLKSCACPKCGQARRATGPARIQKQKSVESNT